MKLWILKPINEGATEDYEGHPRRIWSWDCAYGFVVRAKSEESARRLIAEADRMDWEHSPGDEGASVWLDEGLTSCVEIDPHGEEAIILRDFVSG